MAGWQATPTRGAAMKPYSVDLRQRVLADCDAGTRTEEVAATCRGCSGARTCLTVITPRPNRHSCSVRLSRVSQQEITTHCRVLKAETPSLRRSRLLLCDLTARVIRQG